MYTTCKCIKPTIAFLARSVVGCFDVAFGTFAYVRTKSVDTKLCAGTGHFATFINV